jgi:outer membrane receptor protein involved in Fe transport
VLSGVNFRYVSSRTSAKGATAPSYFTVNLTLFSHRFINGLELTASVYNVLDRQILEPAPLELMQSLVQQDGRTFQVKLAYRF